MITEEDLDDLIAKEAIQKGWAENKCIFAARILKILVKDVEDKQTRNNLRKVIKFLEEYKLE